MSSDSTAIAKFSHAENALTRFPPNVEQIRVQHDSTVTWLIVRRNEVELRFPLRREDSKHLAELLLAEDFEE